jgi:aminoglycoside phosphotransferase (APT) family kinase protein
LADWLQQAAPHIGTPISLSKFATGQSNPTYRLQTSHGAKGGRFVLRTQPGGVLLKSAHAVDREYRIMKALGSSAVPVPDMIAMCDDPKIIGVKFFIMREVDGKTIFSPTLDGYNMADRGALFFGQVGILAALAKLDPFSLSLQDFGKTSGYIERQLRTWTRQYRACETETIPAMEFLLKQLPACLAIELPGLCVIHGDFRLDNLLICNQIDIAALIDWELSTLGPTFVDLSYWCAMLRMDSDWPIGGLGGVDRANLGIPEEAKLVDAFCEETGLHRPDNWDALIAFQCFRFAAILQGVLKRHLDGNASANNAASVGSQAKLVAELGANVLLQYLSSIH